MRMPRSGVPGGRSSSLGWKVVDDQQGDGGEQFHVFLAFAIEGGVSQFLQQPVGFAIQNTVALLDDGVSDGLGAVTFPAPWRAKEQGIFAFSDPVRRVAILSQFADEWIDLASRLSRACGLRSRYRRTKRYSGTRSSSIVAQASSEAALPYCWPARACP